MKKNITIAIDGHSSCGKSTMAKAVAKHFAYRYIDTGAMYRTVALYAIQNNIIENDIIDKEVLKKYINENKIDIDFVFNEENKKSETHLNGKNVENKIRGLEVSNLVSHVAKIDFVRTYLVAQQRKMGEKGAIVMDGRDIGTVVFPNAELKIFLTASAEVRAKRRFDELTAKGEKVSLQEIMENIMKRDKLDSEREIAPLIQADDAILIDNSNISKEEQTQLVVSKVNEILS